MDERRNVQNSIDNYRARILGIEFDLAQLKAWNRNGSNDESIKALEKALLTYKLRLSELNEMR